MTFTTDWSIGSVREVVDLTGSGLIPDAEKHLNARSSYLPNPLITCFGNVKELTLLITSQSQRNKLILTDPYFSEGDVVGSRSCRINILIAGECLA